MNEWREYIRQNKFSMSYGSRIHGSIMPILSGIPAVLECQDARTREMAEFFHIPCVFPEKNKKIDLYEVYQNADYSKFNDHFADKFNAYEEFLQKHNIVKHINENNIFFHPIEEHICTSANKQRRAELLLKFKKGNFYYTGYSKVLQLKRKIRAIIKR